MQAESATDYPALFDGGTRSGLAGPAWLTTTDTWIRYLSEFPAVAILILEMIVIAAGVISRYVFHAPLIWTDEVASVLFVWLSMLGSVVALQRGEHMRLATVMQWMPPHWQARLHTLGLILALGSIAVILPAAFDHAISQQIVTMATLGISESFRSSGLVVGCGLLAITLVLQLVRRSTLKDTIGAITGAAVVFGGLWMCRSLLTSIGNLNLIFFFVILLAVLIVIALPIAFTFILCTVSYLLITTRMPLMVVVSRMEEGMSSMVLLAIPLFVYLGLLIEVTGLARALVNFMAALLGHVRGGLAYVLLGAMFLVSGISGSKAADMAAVAPGLIPEMKRRGMIQGELAAMLGGSAVMTETIPPSLVLIMIGSATGISIGALFRGGLVPALICTLALVIVVYFRAGRVDVSAAPRPSFGVIFRSFLVALPALVLPIVIRTAVVEGVATATEVSTIGVIYTLLIGIVFYRELEWRRMYPILVATVSLTGAVLLILGMAIAMAWALTQSGFARQLVLAMTSMPGGAWGFLGVSILGFIILGSVLEGLPAILVFSPLLFPASRALGINDIHYSMVIIIAMGIGLYAPPLGIGYYSACAIARVPPGEAMMRIWPYLFALLLALALIAAVPLFSIGTL
jgi:tripartite ATP-independent transporter DctM subunit